MKNLKKVLSLALAFAMVLGLCIGASAAQDVTTLADWSEVEDKDAATLLNAFNIMQGDDKGFRPNDNVKRTEAAKMISVALWGGNDDVALYSGNNIGGYTDVVAGAWYMGYVNYMTVQTIMAGNGNGEFNVNGDVTGYELLKMCLVSLGYSPETEGLVGAGWDVRTMALATRPGFRNLTAGTTVTNWNAPLSRMNAATIIANMIKRNTVHYDLTSGVGGNVVSKVEKNDTTFATDYLGMTDETGVLVANEAGSIGTITKTIDKAARGYKGENAIVDFDGEQVPMVLASTADQLGSQVKAYYKGGRFVYAAVSETAEVEPTFDASGAMTNGDQVTVEGVTTPAVTCYINGGETSDMSSVYTVTNKVMTVKDNASVKFLDTDGFGYIDTVVAFTYGANEIKADNTKIKDANDGYTLNNAKKVLKTACDFEAAKGDKIMVTELTNAFGEKVQHGYVMETVEGKVTRASADGKTLYIDGIKYTNNETISGLSITSEGTFWLYANGNIQSFEGTKTAAAGPDGYALVYKAGYETVGTTTTIGGKANTTVQVAAVLPDGTDKIFTVGGAVRLVKSDEEGYDAENPAYKTEAATKFLNDDRNAFAAYEGLTLHATNDQLVAYSLNEDGTINLYAEVIGEATGTNLTSAGVTNNVATVATADGTKYLTSDSVIYVQTSVDDAAKNTTEKWVVYKGLTTPSFTMKATGTATNMKVVVGDRFEKADALKVAYAMVGADEFEATTATTESPLFVILTTPELVAKDTYEAKIYNGSTNKVETVQYKGTAGAKGEFYTAFSEATGFATPITPATTNAGFITTFADNTIRIAMLQTKHEDAVEADAENGVAAADEVLAALYSPITLQVNKDTKYYSVDIKGETAEQITANDIAAQMTSAEVLATTTVKGYQAIVVEGKNADDSASGIATTVIILADATAIPTND